MISSERSPTETVKRPKPGIQRAWHWLTSPAASVKNLADQRQARLLASMMLILAVLTVTGILSVLLSDSKGANLPTQITLSIIFVVSYLVSRSRRYLWAAGLSGLSIAALPFISYLNRGDYSYVASFDALIWMIVALVFANLFFSAKAIAIFALGLMASLAALPLLIPELEFSSVFVILTLNLIVGTISLVNKRYRDLQELDRQAQLRAANLQLQAAGNTLEARVADRTRDLLLAAELGSTLSQVGQLDSLLADAVELIRARFNLYYVQIYLSDETGSSLVLRAGTGAIGQTLLTQEHRLLFGPGSINGMAATNRKAVVVADTRADSIFFANRLLPDTRSELAIPLLIADRVVGVLDLQSDRTNALTRDNLPAFSALAGQLAITIENASSFTAMSRAQAELEASVASQSRANWGEFLDAIHRREHIEFVYESPSPQSATELTTATSPAAKEPLSIPISVTGTEVGAINLTRDPAETWTEAELEIASAISVQVAQKIENLRLLAEAEQYRQEAEDAAGRLVHEGWQNYLRASQTQIAGYRYDHDQVAPIVPHIAEADSSTIRRPLTVGGETIGYLDIASMDRRPDQVTSLVDAVAEQLGAHIENLRLAQQTAQALSATEEQARRLVMLNEMSEALNRAPTMNDILGIAATHTSQILAVDNAVLTMLNSTGDQVEVVAVAGQENASAVGDIYPVIEGSPLIAAIREKRLVTTHDGGNELAGIAAAMLAPLSGETDVIGTLGVGSESLASFTLSDEILILQIAAILGATIERRRLADQVQARADREQILRQITARVHAAADAQSILHTAAQEVNRALGLESFVYLEAESSGSEKGSCKTNGNHR